MEKQLEKKDGATRCRFCVHAVNEKSYCSLKKSSVAMNKKRHCASYVLDSTKVDMVSLLSSSKIPTVRGIIDRGLRREVITKQNAAAKEALRMQEMNISRVEETKFPLTGDLSRFTTSSAPAAADRELVFNKVSTTEDPMASEDVVVIQENNPLETE